MTTARPTPTVAGAAYELLLGDAATVLKTLPANSVQCCVTSPPYFGLRDYGTATWEGGDASCDHVQVKEQRKAASGSSRLGFPADGGPRRISDDNGYFTESKEQKYRDTCGKCGARRVDQQIGIEATPEAYVANLVDVFREVRRVLRSDGTCWLNLGDSYNGSGGAGGDYGPGGLKEGQPKYPGRNVNGLGPKQLLGIPWRVAFALQADGWYLRSEIIWAKKAPMPESVTDRPTKAHEQVFLLAKSPKYFFDADAIREPASQSTITRSQQGNGLAVNAHDSKIRQADRSMAMGGTKVREGRDFKADVENGRNKRSVWTLGPESYTGAHYATMPTKLVEPCILAGTSSYGCCSACGSPWERQVEREKVGQLRPMTGSGGVHPQSNYRTHAENGRITDDTSTLNHVFNSVTTGWQPTCTCNAPVTECVVLDPFFGSGTVAAVALKRGRRFVGIDLDERNIHLAHDRIGRSQPLLLLETA